MGVRAGSPGTVLIVDDDPTTLTIVTAIVKGGGFVSCGAKDGVVALSRLECLRADLVVLDLIMPNKEGLETLIEIKARWPDTKVIAISGGTASLDADELLRMARALGADAIATKPLRSTEFLALVREVLARPPARPALAS
jgi:DNA-binding response OmpR family regulator